MLSDDIATTGEELALELVALRGMDCHNMQGSNTDNQRLDSSSFSSSSSGVLSTTSLPIQEITRTQSAEEEAVQALKELANFSDDQFLASTTASTVSSSCNVPKRGKHPVNGGSKLVKFLGVLNVLVDIWQHDETCAIVESNQRAEAEAVASGHPWGEAEIAQAREMEMSSMFTAVIEHHTKLRMPTDSANVGSRYKHKIMALEMMMYVYRHKIMAYDQFWAETSLNVMVDGVALHHGVNAAGRYFGLTFPGNLKKNEDGDGLLFMILFAVASLPAAVASGRIWVMAELGLREFFIPMFLNADFGMLVGMRRAGNDEVEILTAAANWMFYFMTSRVIVKAASKNRMLQLVEHLMCRKRSTSGGDAQPGYFRLAIICYAILQHFFQAYKPPKSRNVPVPMERTWKEPQKKVDFSVVPKLSETLFMRLGGVSSGYSGPLCTTVSTVFPENDPWSDSSITVPSTDSGSALGKRQERETDTISIDNRDSVKHRLKRNPLEGAAMDSIQAPISNPARVFDSVDGSPVSARRTIAKRNTHSSSPMLTQRPSPMMSIVAEELSAKDSTGSGTGSGLLSGNSLQANFPEPTKVSECTDTQKVSENGIAVLDQPTCCEFDDIGSSGLPENAGVALWTLGSN